MPTTATHAPGTFCWPELASTDQPKAREFYRQLFGWEPQDSPIAPGEVYTIFQMNGHSVAALYNMSAGERAAAPQSHWNSYVSVANADESVKKTAELGGTVIKPAFDVMDMGRMAVLQDPTGGAFCVWQAYNQPGVGRLNEPGALAWTQLNTAKSAAAEKFYTGLFGWGAHRNPMPEGGEYVILLRGHEPAGGIMPMPPGVDAPSHWLVYFGSTDVDASAKRAQSLGATLMVPPTDIPGMARFSVIQDPQGALFTVVKFAG